MKKYLESLKVLDNLFDEFNKIFFKGKLIKPVVTVYPERKNTILGHCTCNKVWLDKSDVTFLGSYEINLSASRLDREPFKICETLLHEMCHLYASQNGIKDVSRGGAYHNKEFKKIAEEHGLIVGLNKKLGYQDTSLTDASFKKLEKFFDTILSIFRLDFQKPVSKKSSTKKYVCSECGISVRATKEVNIVCGDCKLPMTVEE
jgi:predicted SprT family Zn-dependent metalloprotease